MNRKNPFLQDYEEDNQPQNNRYRAPPQTTYESSQQEKERIRRQYEVNDNIMNEDLPPSYDEIAPSRRNVTPQDVKQTHRSRSKKKSSKTAKPAIAKNVDTIDKLDVTGLFGGAFHHDGPFDACTPHRNKNKKAAPVLAFPKNGPNSSLTGKVNTAKGYQSKMNQVFGVSNSYGNIADGDDNEDDVVYSMDSSRMTLRGQKGEVLDKHNGSLQGNGNGSSTTISAIKNNNSMTNLNTNERVKIHGPVSQGLGSTTFLDGAPAPRKEQERQEKIQRSLSRKKSISHRLGLRSETPTNYTSGDVTKVKSDNTNQYFSNDFDNGKQSTGSKLLRRVKTLGRRS
ncbi:uncharacterized protein HGUI_02877 [Hanseniaspora guilliermondii]|uniref:Pal1 cell morphology protein n=1 Tax=Hanseniaspora guilliermondii TaxID=56406 RepID=A0A1L0CP29_9ASCO|nr:uncharacterized protein HGUI_02877 [Hanseniaspora guilliermondii]